MLTQTALIAFAAIAAAGLALQYFSNLQIRQQLDLSQAQFGHLHSPQNWLGQQQPYLPYPVLGEIIESPDGAKIWDPTLRQWRNNPRQSRWAALILSFLFVLFLYFIFS